MHKINGGVPKWRTISPMVLWILPGLFLWPACFFALRRGVPWGEARGVHEPLIPFYCFWMIRGNRRKKNEIQSLSALRAHKLDIQGWWSFATKLLDVHLLDLWGSSGSTESMVLIVALLMINMALIFDNATEIVCCHLLKRALFGKWALTSLSEVRARWLLIQINALSEHSLRLLVHRRKRIGESQVHEDTH